MCYQNTYTRSFHLILSMKRRIMLYTGYIWNEGIFKAFVFHIFLYWECPSETLLYTPRDEKQKKTTTQYFIRITVQIQVHAHNESQLPNNLVSVTTLLQCSVVYMGNYFFPHVNVKGRKNKRCLVCSELTTAAWSGHHFHLKLDLFFLQKSTIACPNVLVVFGPSHCPLKVKE